MSKGTWLRWAGMMSGSAFLLQLGGCFGNDFLIRFAGAGGIVAGLVTLLGA